VVPVPGIIIPGLKTKLGKSDCLPRQIPLQTGHNLVEITVAAFIPIIIQKSEFVVNEDLGFWKQLIIDRPVKIVLIIPEVLVLILIIPLKKIIVADLVAELVVHDTDLGGGGIAQAVDLGRELCGRAVRSIHKIVVDVKITEREREVQVDSAPLVHIVLARLIAVKPSCPEIHRLKKMAFPDPERDIQKKFGAQGKNIILGRFAGGEIDVAVVLPLRRQAGLKGGLPLAEAVYALEFILAKDECFSF
jgi:hypothetical protein